MKVFRTRKSGDASIRGHQTRLDLTQDGAPVPIDTITNFSLNQDANFSKSFYVGAAIPEGDTSYEGFSGTFDMEVKNKTIEEYFDAMIANNLAGIGVSDYVLLDTEFFPDGSSTTYAYYDGQFSMSKTAGGSNEKVTKSISFQFSGRTKVA